MNQTELIKKLQAPKGMLDVVLDTDTYNEVDDQFALAYLLRSDDRLNCCAVYAAPFFNKRSESPADGMEKSYREILNVLKLCNRSDLEPNVYRGSTAYLHDEKTPVVSDAARDLVARANAREKDDPLYVVAIGAITNVASAILLDPGIIEKIVVVWLGGHALHWEHNREFNLMQDIAAARVIMGCGVPFVQLPCGGVVSEFSTTVPELKHFLAGANPLCDYLVDIVADYGKHVNGSWGKVLWDVTAVAWLINDGERFMRDRLIYAPIPEYDHHYANAGNNHFCKYVYCIHRNALFTDLFEKLKK